MMVLSNHLLGFVFFVCFYFLAMVTLVFFFPKDLNAKSQVYLSDVYVRLFILWMWPLAQPTGKNAET